MSFHSGLELGEADFLDVVGSKIRTQIISVFAESTTYGIHLVLSIAAIVALASQDLKSPSTKIMLFFLVTLTALTTASWVVVFGQAIVFLQYTHLEGSANLTFTERWMLAREHQLPWAFPTIWISSGQSTFLYLVGDVVILWRAFILWTRGHKVLLVIPTVLLFAAFALSVTSSVLLTFLHTPSATIEIALHWQALKLAGVVCNLASNIASTALICYQAYAMGVLGRKSALARTRPGTVLVYYVESGVVYLVIQAVKFGLSFTDPIKLV